jgi:hypothetical protein
MIRIIRIPKQTTIGSRVPLTGCVPSVHLLSLAFVFLFYRQLFENIFLLCRSSLYNYHNNNYTEGRREKTHDFFIHNLDGMGYIICPRFHVYIYTCWRKEKRLNSHIVRQTFDHQIKVNFDVHFFYSYRSHL